MYPLGRVEKLCTPEFIAERWGRRGVQQVKNLPMLRTDHVEKGRYRHSSSDDDIPRLEPYGLSLGLRRHSRLESSNLTII
jgi:hypothetical protein